MGPSGGVALTRISRERVPQTSAAHSFTIRGTYYWVFAVYWWYILRRGELRWHPYL